MLGRRIGRDLVACLLQTTFNRRSERSIVVNDIYKSRQGRAPVDTRERKVSAIGRASYAEGYQAIFQRQTNIVPIPPIIEFTVK
jgi:hypothetical protein